MGYDIHSPRNINVSSSNDSTFAIYVGNDNGVSTKNNKLASVSSEMLHVVGINDKNEADTTILVAPNFPVALGRINSNSSDTRADTHIYLVNNNMPTGGFLHRLQNTCSGTGFFGPVDTIRYWDLQKFGAGTIAKNYDSIYWEGKQPQKLQGYCVGYGISADGTTKTVADTKSIKPICGSNTLKGWTYTHPTDSNQNHSFQDFYGSHTLIESYPYEEGSTEMDIAWDVFEQIDPRAENYELLATGDLLPNSKLRPTNLGFHTKEFSEFGIVLETDGKKVNSTSHQEYIGKTQETVKTENMFETTRIKSATKTTNQMRRYGIARLVEATFDWHFNPVDFETLKPSDEIPLVRNFDYVTFDTPSADSGEIKADDDLAAHTFDSTPITGEYSVTSGEGDVFYHSTSIGDQSTIDRLPSVPTATNGMLAIHKSNGFFVNDVFEFMGDSDYTSNIIRLDGNQYSAGVTRFKLYSTQDFDIENLTKRDEVSGFRANVFKGTNLIRWTDVFLLRPNINNTNLHYSLLDDDDNASDDFDPHNIILPLISEERSGATNRQDKTFSMYHPPYSWLESVGGSGFVNRLHMSRVIAGLTDRNFSGPSNTGSNLVSYGLLSKYGTGISGSSSSTTAHIYDNCIGVFKDVRPTGISSREKDSFKSTSAPLELDTDTNYANYLTNYTTETDHDQHSRNLMIQKYGSDYLAMIGTKSKDMYPLDSLGTDSITTVRSDDHNSFSASTTGLGFSAQFIIKPRFNLTNSQGGVSISNNEVTFHLDEQSKHAWLSYMPNLEGYYLVSETLTDSNTLETARYYGIPASMLKITSHTISAKPTTSQVQEQKIVLDGNPTAGMYRLMRFSEVTFDDTPESVEFNVMKCNGLKYDTVTQDFRTGGTTSDTPYNRESIYQMHVLLNIDTANTTLVRTTGTQAIASFTNNEIIDMYFTDGNNSFRKNVTVKTSRPKGFIGTPSATSTHSNRNENCLTFIFDGSLTGYGVVSASEVFEIQLTKRPQLKDIKNAYVGTTYNIGSQTRDEIENIVKESGLTYDLSESYVTRTGNVVSNGATSATQITCSANVERLAVGDVIHSSDGHLIGEISNISNAVITVGKKYYIPTQHDELIKIDRKTFTTNIQFNETNMLSALNSLSIKQGLEYNIKNSKFVARDIDDNSSKRTYALSHKETNRLFSVESNESLFDKANKVIVIGDGIKYELENPTELDTQEVKIIDPSIRTKADAEVKALETLKIYSDDVKKIKLRLHKDGLELLEPGDIVRLNFPNHNIPKADYTVFEIENVLAGTMTITVGTFNKTIAERLSELGEQQTDTSNITLSRNTEKVETGKQFKDIISIKQISISYEIVGSSNALSYNSNMGFDDIVGFTEEVGFEHSTVTKKSYGGRFDEQEDYI